MHVLLPLRCGACLVPGPALCGACSRALVRVAPPLCDRCGAPLPWPVSRCSECAGRRLSFATARAALVYEELAKALIGHWKERGRRDLARILAVVVAEVVPPPAAHVLTYVPGDRDRLLRRGHGPPERLARELAQHWRVPVRPLLSRTRTVPPQRGFTLAARRRNVAGAFAAAANVAGRVVLVDDVYTTGATVNACAAALRRAGAERVDVICLARAVR